MIDRDDGVDERVECADTMCTGLLDAEGTCGTCGVSFGKEALPERARAAPDDSNEAVANSDAPTSEGDETKPEESAEGDVDEREPCSDELCTGIIHVDTGLCGTCGRSR